MRSHLAAAVAAALIAAFRVAPASAFVDVPISFTVTLQNRSLVPCAGATASGTATIAGHLVGPSSLHSNSPAPKNVTLYLHGLGFGQWFWTFDAVPGFDYASALAAEGHTSVVIDRIGYGESTKPDGNGSCIGLQADVAHQVVAELRAGSYATDGNIGPIAFDHVALVGHSAGGAIAQVETYSFKDVDALAVVSYADQGQSLDALVTFLQAGATCATGQAPGNYVPFGKTDADFDHVMFNTPRPGTGRLPILDGEATADPDVIAATNAMRSPDPCGDDQSIAFEILLSQLLLTTVKVPVLVACGSADALFPPPACSLQALHFLGNPDVTSASIAGGEHAITLGGSAAAFRERMSSWLAARGF